MAAPLQLIKRGIEEGDWVLVAQGYNALTGEEVEVDVGLPTASLNMHKVIEFLSSLLEDDRPPDIKSKPAPKTVKKNTKTKAKVKTTKTARAVGVIRDSENEPLNMTKLPKVPMQSGAVGGNKKMFLPAAHLYNESEAQANSDCARDDEPRESYKPQITKCKCGSKFDLKKVYPGGIIDKSVEPVCEKCLNQRAKK